jgi:methylated-DNA-[protein]-cysteine S-methyltransferase
VGPLRLAAEGEHLRRISFTDDRPGLKAPAEDPGDAPEPGSREDAVLTETARQLAEYFAGERERFDLPLAPRGTEFQRRVWRALSAIPYGTTVSYGEIAARLALPPGSARAVGVANSQNPLPVVVPCHRVIGADGGLTGFAGGLARKERLLALEGSSLF